MGRDESGFEVADWSDSGWVGAGAEDDLDERLMAEDDPVDEREPHVMTALGPIEPAALGLTLFGAWGVPLVGPDRDPATALLHLEQLYATGVRAVVELVSAASKSHLVDLSWLMARSPVHIVTGAGTGDPASEHDAATNVPVRTGLRLPQAAPNSEAATGRGRLPRFLDLSAVDSAGAMADLAANSEGGVPVTVVADPLTLSEARVDALRQSGVRLALITGDDASTMPAVAATFKRLADAGSGDRLALGWAGDPITVMERMPIALMEAGFTSVEVRHLLVDNPLQSLLINGGGGDRSPAR